MNNSGPKRAHSSEAMRLWLQATPIKTARLKYAERHLLDQLAELAKITFVSGMPEVGSDKWKTDFEMMPVVQAALKRSSDATAKSRGIDQQIDQRFLTMIRSSDFRCFAFENPRRMSSEPVEMQKEHWTHYPKWDTGEFKANGLHLIELRVVRSNSAIVDIEERRTIAPGRPGFEADIIAAYQALEKEGALPHGAMTVWFPLINEWVKTHRPNSNMAQSLKGAGNQAIRNAIKRALECKYNRVNKL